MKVVFLTLLLGLVCAVQEEEAAISSSVSELSGEWRAVHFASNNLEKIFDIKGLLRLRYIIVFYKNCVIIITYYYDWVYHAWKPLIIRAIPIGPYIYTFKHNGTNTIEFIPVSEKALVAVNVNVDEAGNKTEQVLLFGKENDIDAKGLQKFKEETKNRGISEENIKDLTKPDECVSVA